MFRSVDDIGEWLAIPEPQRFAGHVISSRLHCSPKALWKLNWFLRNFGYDAELLERDEVDEKQLVGLRGVIKISHIAFQRQFPAAIRRFCTAGRWEELSPLISRTRRWSDDLQLHPNQPILTCPRRYRHRYLDGWKE